tara:strand:- start:143 stop:577 length:435 start_codon:yes stop_codon:yes gene_type:complete
MRIIQIDLDIDFVFGLDSKDLLRLQEIVSNSISSKTDKVIREALDFENLMKYYNQVFEKKVRFFNDKAKTNFEKRIKEGYTKQDIKKVIDNASNDEFHVANKYKHITLEFLSREIIFNRYVSEPTHLIPRNKKPVAAENGHINH